MIINQFVVVSRRFKALKTFVFIIFRTLGLKFREYIELLILLFWAFFRFVKYLVCEALELQFLEDGGQFLVVGLHDSQVVEFCFHGHLGADGGQVLRHLDVFHVGLYPLAQLPLQLVGMRQQFFYASKLVDEFPGRHLSHAGAAGIVVRRVAHQGQHVDNLPAGLHAKLRFHFREPHRLVTAAMPGAEDVDVFSHQLPIVLVGREHIGFHALRPHPLGHGAYHVVGLIAVHLQNRDAIGGKYILDDGHGALDVFWSLFSLCLIFRERLIAEGQSVVESHAYVGGFFLGQHLVERIAETHYG